MQEDRLANRGLTGSPPELGCLMTGSLWWWTVTPKLVLRESSYDRLSGMRHTAPVRGQGEMRGLCRLEPLRKNSVQGEHDDDVDVSFWRQKFCVKQVRVENSATAQLRSLTQAAAWLVVSTLRSGRYQDSELNHFLRLPFVSKANEAFHEYVPWWIIFDYREMVLPFPFLFLLPSFSLGPSHYTKPHIIWLSLLHMCNFTSLLVLYIILKNGEKPKLGRLPFICRRKERCQRVREMWLSKK